MGGVCVVEWAEKATSIFPEDHLRVVFSVTGAEERVVELSAGGEKHKELLGKLSRAVDDDRGVETED